MSTVFNLVELRSGSVADLTLVDADMLIEGGAELEIGWLPPLVNGARNAKILADAPACLLPGGNILGQVMGGQGAAALPVGAPPFVRANP